MTFKNYYVAPDGKRYQTKAKFFAVVTGATPAMIVGANPDRVAIVLTTTGTGATQVGNSNQVLTTSGINLSLTAGPADFTCHDFGDLVTGEWWGISSAASNVSGCEVILYGDPIEE